MTVKVYHGNWEKLRDFDFDSMPHDDPIAEIEGRDDLLALSNGSPSLFILTMGYELVAEVDTDNLSVAWNKTNTIDNYWWLNSGVTPHRTKTRSTCIGDLMVHDRKCYVVDRVGYRLLGA